MQTVYRLLIPASVAGLVLSTVWNAAAWARLPIAAMESGSSLLFVGVFVVWFPTVFRLRKTFSALQSWNGWWVALEGTPNWMRLGAIGVFVYAFVNFFSAFGGGSNAGPADAIEFARVASGHSMVFYGFAAALNYAYDRRSEPGLWRCPV